MYAVGYLNPGMLAEQVQIFIIGFTRGAWHKTPQTIPDCAAPGQPNFPKAISSDRQVRKHGVVVVQPTDRIYIILPD